jgi:hypothetical protein
MFWDDPAEPRRMKDGPQPHGDKAREALDAVMDDQAERNVRRSHAHSTPVDRRPLMVGILAALLIATLWILVAPPEAFQPPPLPAPPPEIMTAGLRMDIYLAALQVESFRQEVGRLPTVLMEALEDPEDGSDLIYEIVGSGTYRISGRRGVDEATYVSTESMADFLANARRVLEEGRQ